MHLGSRMILDATGSRAQYSGGAPVEGAPVPEVAPAHAHPLSGDPGELCAAVTQWRLFENALLVVQVDRNESGRGRAAIEQLVSSGAVDGVKIVAAVSPDVDINDDVDTIWGIFTRFDPARDVVFREISMTGIQPQYGGVMGIDATWKPGYPDAVKMPDEVVRRVEERWKEYFE
jgi:4-hydroxy-3-polyprenylbenzoate decarboxylase